MLVKEKVKYFDGDESIRITFETNKETFIEYGSIFIALSEFDKLYYCFVNKIPYEGGVIRERSNTKIERISKNSPFFIDLFAEIKWHEILILVMSLTRKNATANIRENLEDFDSFVDTVEETLKEVTSDFPNMEIQSLSSFLRYYQSLSKLQKDLFIDKIARIGSAIRKIKSVKINDNSRGKKNIKK